MSGMKKPSAVILAIGTELVTGLSADTNSIEIASILRSHGISLLYKVLVPDDVVAIAACITDAMAAADIVITTGGLGPTLDDVTRDGASLVSGLPIREDENALEKIRERLSKRPDTGKNLAELNYRQAGYLGISLPNKTGSAVGSFVSLDESLLFLLPGPPTECLPMFSESVLPLIFERIPETISVKSHTMLLSTYNAWESDLDALLRTAIPDSYKGIYAKGYRKIVLCESTDKEKLLEDVARLSFHEKIAVYASGLYGIQDPLRPEPVGNVSNSGRIHFRSKELSHYSVNEAIILTDLCPPEFYLLALCVRNRISLATAESCTGGMLASILTEYPGISALYRGSVVAYSNESKVGLLGVNSATLERFGAVSPETAAEMATGIARNTGSELAISITGIAGPEGGIDTKPVGLVYSGIMFENATVTHQYRFSGFRNDIRSLSSIFAMMHAVSAIMDKYGR